VSVASQSSRSDWHPAEVARRRGKLCTKCRLWLPAEAFRPNPTLTSGLNSWCKKCQVERTRLWRMEHRDEENAKRRAGPFPTTCGDCGETFPAVARSQVRCRECQAAKRRMRKR
jgi:hypothetical protein